MYEQKKKTILKNLCIIFEDYKGTVWIIEYQKHGFSHIHYLLFLSQDINHTNCNLIDHIVWAKLPDKELNLTNSLTEPVKTYILCNLYENMNPECIYIKNKNDKCGWRCKASYLKQFQKQTFI